jgi:uncharacterized protein
MSDKNALTHASFLLHENCNLACKYCFESEKKNKAMSKEVAEKGIDFLIKNAKENKVHNISVTFFGGEPLLNLDAMNHIIDYGLEECRKNDLKFECMLITNATIFNEDVVRVFLNWYNKVGWLDVQLSIDGIPEVQDANRIYESGEGSSKVIEENIEKIKEFCKENNLEFAKHFHVHSCLNKNTISKMYESYCYFRDKGFELIWFMPVHEEKWDDEDLKIYSEQTQLIANKIYEDCVKENTDKYIKAYSSFNKCHTKHPNAPCSAGKSYCCITAEGDIYPCHQFYYTDEGTKMGDIYNGVDDNNRLIFIDYEIDSLYGDMQCGNCDQYNCYRCIATNYRENGNMFVGFPAYCKLSREEERIKRELYDLLAEKGVIKYSPFTIRSSDSDNCRCNGNDSCRCNSNNEDKCGCNDNILEDLNKILGPVLKTLDETLSSFSENDKELACRISSIEEKINTILGITVDMAELVIKLYESTFDNKKER